MLKRFPCDLDNLNALKFDFNMAFMTTVPAVPAKQGWGWRSMTCGYQSDAD